MIAFIQLCEQEPQILPRLHQEIEDYYYSDCSPCISNHNNGWCEYFLGRCPKRPGGPVRIKFKSDPVARRQLNVASVLHYASFRRHNMNTPYPSLTDNEYSHLCGNAACVNVDHIRLEPHQLNCDRITCHKTKECRGHQKFGQHDHCIFYAKGDYFFKRSQPCPYTSSSTLPFLALLTHSSSLIYFT